MNKVEQKQLEEIAKALVETLGTMDARQADRVVARSIEVIYRDLLNKKGKILKTKHWFLDYRDEDGLPCGKEVREYEWSK